MTRPDIDGALIESVFSGGTIDRKHYTKLAMYTKHVEAEIARLRAALGTIADMELLDQGQRIDPRDVYLACKYIAREALASTTANAIADSGGDGGQGEAQGRFK